MEYLLSEKREKLKQPEQIFYKVRKKLELIYIKRRNQNQHGKKRKGEKKILENKKQIGQREDQNFWK